MIVPYDYYWPGNHSLFHALQSETWKSWVNFFKLHLCVLEKLLNSTTNYLWVTLRLRIHLISFFGMIGEIWASTSCFFDKFEARMLGLFEQVCEFVESAEKSRKFVEWRSNKVWIGSNFCQTSIRLSFVLKKCWVVSKLFEHFNQICSTFARHSFDARHLNGPLITISLQECLQPKRRRVSGLHQRYLKPISN